MDITVNYNDVTESPIDELFSMTSFSLGAGYRADLNKRISSNIFGGLNYSMLSLENTYESANNPTGTYRLDGVNTLGLRAGIGVDYAVFRNILVFGKGFSNINLVNMSSDEITDGNDVKSEFDLSELSRLNFAVGLKMRF